MGGLCYFGAFDLLVERVEEGIQQLGREIKEKRERADMDER